MGIDDLGGKGKVRLLFDARESLAVGGRDGDRGAGEIEKGI